MKSIAIVGSGIAGLSAAWLLSKRYDVTVFEKMDRIGGHSNTVNVVAPEGQTPVDTGFIVYNKVNYPNLVALFDYLDVETEPSDMSFAIRHERQPSIPRRQNPPEPKRPHPTLRLLFIGDS